MPKRKQRVTARQKAARRKSIAIARKHRKKNTSRRAKKGWQKTKSVRTRKKMSKGQKRAWSNAYDPFASGAMTAPF